MDEYTREMVEVIVRQRDVSTDEAQSLVTAAEGFWAALGELGFVDGYGGSEFCRIFPEVVETIHRLANPLAHMTRAEIEEMT